MADDVARADSAWLVDAVVQFMRSPSWNEPLQGFISEKCILFDNFEEENRHEYVEIHNEFKSLIDNLLAAHLLEVDIAPEEFEQQVLQSGLAEDPRLQKVFGQLMAAEDFMTFKTMMVEQHAKMQSQAESNFKTGPGLSEEEERLANDAAIAAAIAADAAAEEEAERARAEAAAAAAASAAVSSATAPAAGSAGAPRLQVAPVAGLAVPAAVPAGPAQPPTEEQERAFGAGGGFYGRAALGAGAKKPATNEKAAAVRKALLSGLRPQ